MQHQRIIHHASRMAIVTLVCRISGYIRDKALFWVLGAGDLYDMYRTANRIPNAFRGLFAEGTLHAAFVPSLSQALATKEGRSEARDLLRGLVATMLLVVGGVVALGIVFSPWLVRLYAEGFSGTPGKLETTVLMNRLMFSYLLLITLAAIFQAVLNSHERFLLSASTPIFFNLTVAATALFLVPRVGRPEIVLSFAVLVGGLLQFLVQLPAVRKLGFRVSPVWRQISSPGVRQVLLLMLPGIPVLGINQINQLISNRFASFVGEGGVSYTYGAYRVTELMFGLVVVQLTTVLLPVLSRELVDSPKTAPDTLLRTISIVGFVTLPAATAMAFFSRPIIGLLFGGGQFDSQDVSITAATLTAYAFSLVGTGHVKVMAGAFFAQKNTKLPMWGSLIALVVFTIGSWAVVDRLGTPGLGWANTASMACFAVFLTLLYRQRYGFGTERVAGVYPSLARQIVGSAVLAAILWLARPLVDDVDATNLWNAIRVGAALGVSGLAYLSVVTVLGGKEMNLIRGAIASRSAR
ncbi:MAG: murein biosynthesis integral membrane protein MurJ [bacterium]|nr:murein biosynthesis integral membrane protein MurJ [bacterium]